MEEKGSSYFLSHKFSQMLDLKLAIAYTEIIVIATKLDLSFKIKNPTYCKIPYEECYDLKEIISEYTI